MTAKRRFEYAFSRPDAVSSVLVRCDSYLIVPIDFVALG